MSEGYEIFERWVDKVKPEIDSGKEIKVPVKSLETFSKMVVKAKIGRSKDKLPDGEHLRVVNDMGEKRSEMFIKVLEELGEEESSLSVEF